MPRQKLPPIVRPKPMTGQQFEKTIAKLGFTQQSFARSIFVHGRTVQSWINGRLEVPLHIAMLVNLMADTEAVAENLRVK